MKTLVLLLWSLAFLPGGTSSVAGRRSVTIHAVAFSPDGKYLVTAGICRPVVLRDATTGKEVRRLAQQSSWEGNAAFTPDGNHVLATERSDRLSDDTVVLLPVSGTGEHPVVGKVANGAWILQLSLSGDGKTLAGVGGDGPVLVWDVAARTEIRRLDGKGFRSGVALSPDGKIVASTSVNDGPAQIWETATGKRLESPSDPYAGVAFSPDGKRIAFGRSERILLWDPQAGKAEATLTIGAECLAFSPDGKRLAAGRGKTIAIWNLAQSKKTLALEASGTVTSLAINPDGKTVAAGLYEPGGLQIWSLEDGKPLVGLELPPNSTR